MLQSLSLHPSAPVLRRPLNIHPRAEPVADIRAVGVAHDLLKCKLEVYFRDTQRQQLIQAGWGIATESTERRADYTIQRSYSDLRRLRTAAERCLGCGDHCYQCKRVASYLKYCWERQRLLKPSWNGTMSMDMDVLARFLNHLLSLTSQFAVSEPQVSEQHAAFASLVTTFLQPSDAKDE